MTLRQCPFCGVKYSVKQYGEYCPLGDWPRHIGQYTHTAAQRMFLQKINSVLQLPEKFLNANPSSYAEQDARQRAAAGKQRAAAGKLLKIGLRNSVADHE